jgi:hypothetical protein
MKLYQYLNESRGKPIKDDKFLNNIKTCSDIISYYNKTEKYLYRGAGYNGDIMYLNPSSYTRKSKDDTNNYYTLLFDEILPSWKNYPKRSKSVIMTDDKGYASDYGNLYIVLPFNGSLMASTKPNTSDIWYSFDYKLNTLNAHLEEMFDEYGLNGQDSNASILEKEINKLGEIMRKENVRDNRLGKLFNESRYKTLIDFLNDYYNPNGRIDLFKTNNINIQKDQEVWTSGPCYVIDYYKYQQLTEKLQ